MNIEQLKFIQAIVEEGSFRKASEKLYISQPAISSSIKKLEQDLKIDLFDKASYKATLTEEGKAFYQKAMMVLENFGRLEEFGYSLGLGVEYEFNIVVDAAFPINIILEVLDIISEKYPNTKLNIFVDYLENILEYIEEKKFDILITSLVSIKDSVIELENIFLHSDKMYFVAAPCFPLANKEIITKEDLKQYPQIILKAKSSRDYGIVNNEKKWNVNDFFLKKQLIMHGIGYGSLPEFYILEELKNGKLIHLTNYPDFEDLKVNFYAFRNKNIKHGKVSNEFWDFIKNIT